MFPVWDKTLPTVIGCLDRSMRAVWWRADVLVDGQRTDRVDRAHRRDRRPASVDRRQVGHHYGVTIATCVPADPESKGGVERTVQIAKADLVPTDTNLRDDYASWAELVDACMMFMDKVNGREHRVTRRPPGGDARRGTGHGCIADAGRQRSPRRSGRPASVSWTSTISFGGVTYSVPHTLADQSVWVRVDGDEIVATHIPMSGPVEVARHRAFDPGEPAHR